LKKKTNYIGDFQEHINNSPDYINNVNSLLIELEEIIKDLDITQVSETEIHLFATLRSLSIVKGIIYPSEVEKYRINMSKKTNIPLHDNIAL
jgi:glutaredoxin 2